jgi:hypothetical protein
MKSSAPELVVQPISTEEVSQIMKFANRHNIPVTVRGQWYRARWRLCTSLWWNFIGYAKDESYS